MGFERHPTRRPTKSRHSANDDRNPSCNHVNPHHGHDSTEDKGQGPFSRSKSPRWQYWLVDDQREFSGRTDVLTYATPPLETPVAVAGEPVANLVAGTTGMDAD